MDPLTAVGLVANILQFVELGCKIFANAKEIRHSASGLTLNDQRTVDVISEMHMLSANLETPGKEPSDANGKALFKLARECRKLSHEIQKLLYETSAKNPGSSYEVIRSTMRRMSANIKDQLISLATDNKTQLSTINDLDASLKRLHGRVFSLSLSNDDLMEKIQELLQLPQAAREAVAQQQILRMLDHDDFHLRYDIVDKAHQETFRWIIEEGKNDESEHLSDSRKLLRTWLAEEQGIFHIAGKLGSGKSTLMKFLSSHPNTSSDLQIWSDIQTALGNILTNPHVHKTHRFCFFIDALDEQNDPSPQNDHKALVEMIQRWTESPDGALKVCVSSREDNVFMNAFNPNRRLRLQDLTRQDLEKYVRQKLPDIPSTDVRRRISSTIVWRSRGIFLWVVLVVKALREAFEDGRELSDFEAELNTLPSEQEALFAHLLRTIPTSRRRNAYCLLKLMTYEIPPLYDELDIPLHAILYLDKYLKNPRFALEDDPSQPNLHQYLHSKVSSRREVELVKARKMLQGDCRGLVESAGLYQPGEHYMTFTHRSVPEFLDKTATKEVMDRETGGFIPAEALAQMLLGQVRAAENRADIRAENGPRYNTVPPAYIYEVLLSYHHEKRRQCDPTNEYLTALEKELERKGLALPVPYTHGFYGVDDHAGPPRVYSNLERPGETFGITHPYYLLALFGDLDYVKWKLEQDPLFMAHTGNRSLLLACMLYGVLASDETWLLGPHWIVGPQCVKIIRQLLSMGPVDCLKYILALLIAGLDDLWWEKHDEFMESKTFFGTMLAALLGKVEEKNTVVIRFTIAGAGIRIYWNGVDLEEGSIPHSISPPSELDTKLKKEPYKLRRWIQLMEFENGDEILALIDKFEAPAGSSSGLDQTTDTGCTSTSRAQTPNLSVELNAEPLEEDTSPDREIPKEEAADDCEKTPVQAPRSQLPGSLSSVWYVYLLFALLGKLSTLLSSSRALIYLPEILCALVIHRVLSE
ncbi:hypothetical protein SLS60_002405 [Paraconiothyrium brasiliense]|uniref:DUF7791 domain-containing protein n=1 Tax=Paraconiothyrium brasiliense TaxID=300254 RepID=A0ABR3S225_9PLEO